MQPGRKGNVGGPQRSLECCDMKVSTQLDCEPVGLTLESPRKHPMRVHRVVSWGRSPSPRASVHPEARGGRPGRRRAAALKKGEPRVRASRGARAPRLAPPHSRRLPPPTRAPPAPVDAVSSSFLLVWETFWMCGTYRSHKYEELSEV